MKKAERRETGGTRKVTISLRPADLEVVARLAALRHGGNVSGAFAELIRHAARLEAMDRVLAELPPPSPEELARLDSEMAAPPARARRGRRPRRTSRAA